MSSQRHLHQLYRVTSAYITTNDFLRVPGSLIDVRSFFTRSIAIRVANSHAANVISYKVRGSIDGSNFTDVITITLAGVEQAATGADVNGAASAEVFITDAYDSGAPAAFNFYDVVAESKVDDSAGTVVVTISAR